MSNLDRAAIFSCLFGIGVALAVGVPAVASFGIILGAFAFLVGPKAPSPASQGQGERGDG